MKSDRHTERTALPWKWACTAMEVKGSQQSSRSQHVDVPSHLTASGGANPNSSWLKTSSCRTTRGNVSTRLRCFNTTTPEREFVQAEEERKGPTVMWRALPWPCFFYSAKDCVVHLLKVRTPFLTNLGFSFLEMAASLNWRFLVLIPVKWKTC